MGRPHLEAYWRLTGRQAGRHVYTCILMRAEHLLAKMGSCYVTGVVWCSLERSAAWRPLYSTPSKSKINLFHKLKFH